jgi:hypothetical protein
MVKPARGSSEEGKEPAVHPSDSCSVPPNKCMRLRKGSKTVENRYNIPIPKINVAIATVTVNTILNINGSFVRDRNSCARYSMIQPRVKFQS